MGYYIGKEYFAGQPKTSLQLFRQALQHMGLAHILVGAGTPTQTVTIHPEGDHYIDFVFDGNGDWLVVDMGTVSN